MLFSQAFDALLPVAEPLFFLIGQLKQHLPTQNNNNMNLPSYLCLVTIEHGYLLVKPEDIQAIFRKDPETNIPLFLSTTLDFAQQPVIDSVGNQWIPLEEDCEAPEFIERLADHLHIFPHQLRQRIKRYEPNLTTAQLAHYVQNNNINEMCLNLPMS